MKGTVCRGFAETVSKLQALQGITAISPQKLLLEYGRDYPYAPLPKGIRMGKRSYCYRNAFDLALRFPGEYTYVEGLALGSLIPVEHAWCVDDAGYVIDNTWSPAIIPPEDREYFGIPIKLPYVIDIVVKSKYQTVLWNWMAEWPMCKDDPSTWLSMWAQASEQAR